MRFAGAEMQIPYVSLPPCLGCPGVQPISLWPAGPRKPRSCGSAGGRLLGPRCRCQFESRTRARRLRRVRSGFVPTSLFRWERDKGFQDRAFDDAVALFVLYVVRHNEDSVVSAECIERWTSLGPVFFHHAWDGSERRGDVVRTGGSMQRVIGGPLGTRVREAFWSSSGPTRRICSATFCTSCAFRYRDPRS